MALAGALSVYSNVDRPELVVPPLGIFGAHHQDLDDDDLANEGEVPLLAVSFGIAYTCQP